MSEPEPENGNVNTVYFVNQPRGNTRISRTEFVYDERARDCNCCWRALARQHPILCNSEKKAKSVGCKIEDMRSRFFFYIRAFWGAC